MSNNTKRTSSGGSARYILVLVLVIGAFFGAYRFAAAKNSTPGSAGNLAAASGGAVQAGSSSAGGSGCACCGSTAPTEGGLTGDKVEGTAQVEGDVQKISVDLSKGYYEPNAIVLKAGVPAEITFGASSGCTGQVVSQELGFAEDLSTGAKTVKLPALEKGEYPFYCGMQMVYGKITVE